MIQECIQGGALFGVVLIKEGVEALGPLPEPHHIGCIAEIAQLQSLQDGRMNLVAIGRQRFQILSLHHDRPYLRAIVEQFPLEANPDEGAAAAGKRLIPQLEEYLAMLSTAGNVVFDISALPVKHLPIWQRLFYRFRTSRSRIFLRRQVSMRYWRSYMNSIAVSCRCYVSCCRRTTHHRRVQCHFL